jgi:nucleoside-diphosphate-sugar epimerase
MARVMVLGIDLMLASRVTTSLSGAGHEVEQVRSPPDELDGVDLVVADLDAIEPEALGELGVPVLGFHQHTDVETKRRAETAGIDLVVPRSRMVRELPELAERLLARK